MKSVETIIQKAGGMEAVRNEYLSIENPPFMRLVVEVIRGPYPNGSYQVSVAHYTTQNGDAMRDPEIVFHVVTGEEWEWKPLFVQMDFLSHYSEAGEVDSQGTWRAINSSKAADLSRFSKMWARNIKAQGFIEALERRAV